MSRVEEAQDSGLRRRGQNPAAAAAVDDPQERATNFETRDLSAFN